MYFLYEIEFLPVPMWVWDYFDTEMGNKVKRLRTYDLRLIHTECCFLAERRLDRSFVHCPELFGGFAIVMIDGLTYL